MTRRHILPLLAALALTLPLCAWPQQPARLPLVGVLSPGGPTSCESGKLGFLVACMIEGLRTLGRVEGRDVAFEIRYANGDSGRLHAWAAELVALRPDVLYTFTAAGADAAAVATTTIPVVAGPAGEGIMVRLAGNLARPTGNVTGLTLNTGNLEQDQKSLQLLKELAPRASRVAWIRLPDNPRFRLARASVEAAATQLGLTLVGIDARNAADLPQALAAATAGRADAIYMADDALLAGTMEVRTLVSAWATSRRLPLVSSNAAFAADGALLSLGADIPAIACRAAFYVHRILAGARPADLPVERPTVYKLTLNRKTAAALGITIPPALSLRADEVIQ